MSDQASSGAHGTSPTAKFALWMLAADTLVAAAMLMILKEPVPVLATFAIIYLWSFAFLRRRIGIRARGDGRGE